MQLFDHPIVLIIIAVAALLRWLVQRSQAAKEDEPKRPEVPGMPIPPSGETQTEEERIRRFLEALGQPTSSTPPRRVIPRPIVPKVLRPHLPPLTPPLPQLTTVPPPLPPAPEAAIQPPPPPPPLPAEEPVFRPAAVLEAGFEVRDIGAPTASESFSDSSRAMAATPGLRSVLASRQGLRNAVILREVFGPPRSLQTFDLIGGY